MNKDKMIMAFSGLMIIVSLFWIIYIFVGNADFNISTIISLFAFVYLFSYGMFFLVVHWKKLKENKENKSIEDEGGSESDQDK